MHSGFGFRHRSFMTPPACDLPSPKTLAIYSRFRMHRARVAAPVVPVRGYQARRELDDQRHT
jgi:hypothetical protein